MTTKGNVITLEILDYYTVMRSAEMWFFFQGNRHTKMFYVEFMCDIAAISACAVCAQANASVGEMNVGVLQDGCVHGLRAAQSPP